MYIRTKDGVYKVSHYNDWATHKRKGATLIDEDKTSYIKNENIIAQSENLEELCDEIVVEYKDCCEKKTYLYNGTFDDLRKTHKYYYSYKFSSFFKYYGCIWVQGKGLIYVAKMNENGELELI